jgi:prepilin-type N-terminal cleavage/methylation domain-containing protein
MHRSNHSGHRSRQALLGTKPALLLSKQAGFTLIELIIVCAIIAIVVAMGLPKLMAARMTANESSAISTLRALASAEVTVVSQAAIDSDGDGAGEDGYFAELAGSVAARASAGGLPAPGVHKLTPVVLSTAFGNIDANGLVARSGYYFQIWLPGAPAGGLTPGISEFPTVGGADPGNLPDANGCEFIWCCYAWPVVVERSGNRTFFINQTGELLQYMNRGGVKYSNTTSKPAFDEAFQTNGDMASNLRVGIAGGHDNTLWTAVH